MSTKRVFMKVKKEGWRAFLEKCLKLESLKDLEAFFTLFLTPSEREEIARRYLIVLELLKGEKTHREIARDLKVSVAKVSRGSNALKTADPEIKKLIKP